MWFCRACWKINSFLQFHNKTHFGNSTGTLRKDGLQKGGTLEKLGCKKVAVNTQLREVLPKRRDISLEVTSLTPFSAKKAAPEHTAQFLQELRTCRCD